jgi:hypothetical protein
MLVAMVTMACLHARGISDKVARDRGSAEYTPADGGHASIGQAITLMKNEQQSPA